MTIDLFSGPAPASEQLDFLNQLINEINEEVSTSETDFMNLKGTFGGVGNGVANDTDAVQAAENYGLPVYVPNGTYRTTINQASITGPFWGYGQIEDSDGNLRGPWFSNVNSRPDPVVTNPGSVLTAFNGDLSKVQMAIEHRITGIATLGQPTTGYLYTNEAYAIRGWLYNSSGWNESTSGTTGRTAAIFSRINVTNVGQGDCVAYNASGFVDGARSGASHFLANPAVSLYNGDVFAGEDGVYLNPVEIQLDDQGFDVSGIGYVTNLTRDNATGALHCYWAGVRVQSIGAAAVDDFFFGSGLAAQGLNFTRADFGVNQAAIVLLQNQRIYGNATAGSDPFRVSSLGTTYFDYDSNISAWNFVTSGVSSLQVYNNQVVSTSKISTEAFYQMKDGVSAPIALVGYAKLYIDIADGDLKIIFGDGTIKTIVVDT